MTADLARTLNILGLFGLSGVLIFAFADQFLLADLPCPLCLLQRVAFVAAGVGIALNVQFGPRPGHYGIAIVSAVVGGAISLRQVALHVVPGTGAYGSALFGLHFYTWAFVAFAMIVVGSAVMLLFDHQFAARPASGWLRVRGVGLVAVGLFAAVALANGLSTFAECGVGLCPDDPTTYEVFRHAPGG